MISVFICQVGYFALLNFDRRAHSIYRISTTTKNQRYEKQQKIKKMEKERQTKNIKCRWQKTNMRSLCKISDCTFKYNRLHEIWDVSENALGFALCCCSLTANRNASRKKCLYVVLCTNILCIHPNIVHCFYFLALFVYRGRERERERDSDCEGRNEKKQERTNIRSAVYRYEANKL